MSDRVIAKMMTSKQHADRLKRAQLKAMLDDGADPELGQKAAKDLLND
jgi:hypothetical protein